MNRSRRLFLAGAAGLSTLSLSSMAWGAALSPQSVPSAESRASPNSTFFTARSADGVSLAVEARGDPAAPEILFIHGLRQSRLSWDKQFDDPALAGFRIVRFDLRGHGDSDKPAEDEAYADADRWADDVAAVIEAAGLRRPVIVGWSLGGYVAGAYLRKYGAERVAGFNLVDAVTKLSPDLLTPLAGAYAATATSSDLAERHAATVEFLLACFHQAPSDEELHRMLVINGMTPSAVNEGFLKSTTPDLEPTFGTYEGSILLTHGAHDRLVRLTMSERIRALSPKHRLSIFNQSGHSPFYEEPDRYNRELAAYVAEMNAASRR